MARIILHTADNPPRFEEVDLTTSIEDFTSAHAGDGACLWRQDETSPLALTATLAEMGIQENDHIHVAHCQSISVTVHHEGRQWKEQVAPGFTIGSIFDRVAGRRGFALTNIEQAEHVLETIAPPMECDDSMHIGSLGIVDCEIELRLRRVQRPEG